MGKISSFLIGYQQHGLAILRVASAMLFLQHGTTKLLGFPLTRYSDMPLLTLGGAAGAIELIGGIMLALGLLTRPVAFIMSGTKRFLAQSPPPITFPALTEAKNIPSLFKKDFL